MASEPKLICCCVSHAVYRQTFSAVICCLSSLTLGLSLGWAAPAFVKIDRGEVDFKLTIFGQSVVVMALNAGIILSTYPAGFCMDRIGRRRTLLLFSTFSLLQWIMICFAPSPIFLYLARFAAGIWAGAISTVVPIYITECVEPRIRGSLATQHVVFMNLGILVAYTVGPQLKYVPFSLFCGAFVILFMVAFSLLPETPYYLAMKQNHGMARKSLIWLRATDNVEEEMKSIQVYIESDLKKSCSFKELFTTYEYRKPFFISGGLYIFQKFTGFFTIIAYQTVILPKNLGILTSENCTQIVGVIILLSVFVATYLMDKAGRRILLFISHTGISFFMFGIGLLFYLSSSKLINIEDYSYYIVIGFVGYVFSYSVGIGPIASMYGSEIIPQAAKGTSCGITASLSSLASALNTLVFAVTANYIGFYWNFFIFSGCSVLTLVYVYVFIVETKGKSFQDIQQSFAKHKVQKPVSSSIS